MAKKYKRKYKQLKECYKLLDEHMLDITDDNERYLNELRYLEAFIEWKNLNEDNKVSLFVRYIDLETGEFDTRIVNKNV